MVLVVEVRRRGLVSPVDATDLVDSSLTMADATSIGVSGTAIELGDFFVLVAMQKPIKNEIYKLESISCCYNTSLTTIKNK